jgi:hypothetical protein
MENNCYFVNSRGILKSCDFHSPNPYSSWAYDESYLIDMIQSSNMFDGMSIYVCTDMLPLFVNKILPNINHNFYLISGDSDATVPNGIIDLYHGNQRPLEEELCLHIANHNKLIKWFAQNYIFNLVEKKICQLPIGLDYHTISNDPNKFWKDTNEGNSTKFQEMVLKNIRNDMKPFYERIPKIYAHMSINGARQEALETIPSNLVEVNDQIMPRTKVWKNMVNYAFILSPYGAGPDCHRHWECLALGCIPIIKTIGSNEMFEDLPVIIVNEWSDINEEFLINTLNSFKNRQFNYNKLLLKYWVDQFSSPPLL